MHGLFCDFFNFLVMHAQLFLSLPATLLQVRRQDLSFVQL